MQTRWLVSAAVMLGILSFAHTGRSQEDVKTFGGSVVDQPEPVRTSELTKTYLELITAQAALMDEATLEEEIKVTQRNIDELKALQQLNEAKRLLLSITAEYSETTAAEQATRMLDSAEPESSQAEFGDGAGPALNTAAGLPFTRSSFSRPLPTAPRRNAAPKRTY